ncbi:MAG TPA: hypothetical protein VFC44_09900 [Candidatus Saccharimonadales bacterium]|nr:hypothetical protein [Candidatus Saccharimonadales bacterium]
MVINLYFSLCGESYFQLLRELFLLIFGFKNCKRYQIAVSDFECSILQFRPLPTPDAPCCELPLELIDKVDESVESYVDLIAERIVQLGNVAEGKVRVAAAMFGNGTARMGKKPSSRCVCAGIAFLRSFSSCLHHGSAR